MCRPFFLVVFSVFACLGAYAQSTIVFNKTEHDFGPIARAEVPFEHDFLFRNTGTEPVHILSVRSIQPSLSFIHTRSEVLEGEYGFVKIKLRTDSLDGLFHDEVYITMRQGQDVLSEVIYLRALVSPEGATDNGRQFQDSRIATSVEVSPDDIETMEGFLGQDKLSQANAEISYLRKQVGLKSELISKMSEDLRQKQQSEQENIQRLAALQSTLKSGSGVDVNAAMEQIDQLTHRLMAIQRSDSILRAEIYSQENVYARLKHEADSARGYAENLSQRLEEQFKAEAEAIQRASQLESDLRSKRITEQRQKRQIDSLQQLIASGAQTDGKVTEEIAQLKEELTWKQKEQELQAAHADRQHEKIEHLKAERAQLQSRTDSLHTFLASRDHENQALQQQLAQSSQRIRSYETAIDSLEQQASLTAEQSASVAELDSLKSTLHHLEQEDQTLKQTIAEKDGELANLQTEKARSEKDLKALEAATGRQLEEAHKLMYKINELSSRESEARMEVMDLKQALNSSASREDSARAAVLELTNHIAERESSIHKMSQALTAKEAELAWAKGEQEALQAEYEKTRNDLATSQNEIDSLKVTAARATERKKTLEGDIAALQSEIIESQRKATTYQDHATELESKLKNAHMSNELAFAEMKADVDEMRNERDDYHQKYKEAMSEIQTLSDELAESRQREHYAMRLVEEMEHQPKKQVETQKALDVIFRVNVLSGDEPEQNLKPLEKLGTVYAYREGGSYRYAIGSLLTLSEALELKERVKNEGYATSYVVAFRDGQRISLKEAMETAGNE